MNCLINETITLYLRKEKKIEVIRRYIRLKYKINMDTESILKRIHSINRDPVQLV